MDPDLVYLRLVVGRALAGGRRKRVPRLTIDGLADAFDARAEELRQRLNVLFGPAAIDALFAHALRVAGAEHTWLAGAVQQTGHGLSTKGLRENGNAARGAAAVEKALVAVLAAALEALVTFIGRDLVLPIIADTWGREVIETSAETENVDE
jgi:hypothetical protein